MRMRRHGKPLVALAVALAGSFLSAAASADAPLSYMRGYGLKAYPVVTLTWALLLISVAVILIIAVLGIAAMLRRRAVLAIGDDRRLPVTRGEGGLQWIYIGVAISTVVLIAAAVWTFLTLAAVGDVPANAALTVEVTGHQWWWQVRYLSDDPSRIFTTANEIHIPAGEPVRFRLIGGDVIHSFWVPALSGKTDVIPGQTNETWLEAEKPGSYRGQCTEYCGLQHAHMALFVVASPPAHFKAWWDSQLRSPAAPVPAGSRRRGGGVSRPLRRLPHGARDRAAGVLGPDLSHLMTRRTIAAGTLPNNPGNLSAWISDPQASEARQPDAGSRLCRDPSWPRFVPISKPCTEGRADRRPAMNGPRYRQSRHDSDLARKLARIWETEPGFSAGWPPSTTRRSASATSSPPSPS